MRIKLNEKYTLQEILLKIGGDLVDTYNDTFPEEYRCRGSGFEIRNKLLKSDFEFLLSCTVTDIAMVMGSTSYFYKIEIDPNSENENNLNISNAVNSNITLKDLLVSSSKNCYFCIHSSSSKYINSELLNKPYSRNDLFSDLYINPEYRDYLSYMVSNIYTTCLNKEGADCAVIRFDLKPNQ